MKNGRAGTVFEVEMEPGLSGAGFGVGYGVITETVHIIVVIKVVGILEWTLNRVVRLWKSRENTILFGEQFERVFSLRGLYLNRRK